MLTNETLIERKVATLFPEPLRGAAMNLLDGRAAEVTGPIATRFRLAVLKLDEEEGSGGIEKLTAIVRSEIRDVLAWAENPGLMEAGPNLTEAKRNRLRARDCEQYRAWLNRP